MAALRIGSVYHVIDDISNQIVIAKITSIDGEYVELRSFNNPHTRYMRKRKDIYKSATEAARHM